MGNLCHSPRHAEYRYSLYEYSTLTLKEHLIESRIHPIQYGIIMSTVPALCNHGPEGLALLNFHTNNHPIRVLINAAHLSKKHMIRCDEVCHIILQQVVGDKASYVKHDIYF